MVWWNFGKKKKENLPREGESARKEEALVARWRERVSDRRAQSYERQEAIEALARLGTPKAGIALLNRFTFTVDPSITDQEEKEAAFQGVIRIGKEVVTAVRGFGKKAESLAWGMKILKHLLSPDEYVQELLFFLGQWDTEYAKFVDPKVQLLTELENVKNPAIPKAVEPFLQDVHEPTRFHAVSALLAQENQSALFPLLSLLKVEESFRVKNKIVEGLARCQWLIPEEEREMVRTHLMHGYTLHEEGIITKA
ncbi:HEAT repeat domain-containing protein [Pajaroellobacter abortibovis]|uniref:HEAT repeat domain-containing protein n=1 Tax=Pajaroellobacter abortibovis TaxID=1882918 RepID=A0A1L6MZ62_9BACT|nr:HEAT repeat domain-containing protein [Pajaroellobacter abortibovis]APS00833.1 hypothetical protein BCY86_01580 [Pajaroellobacter abortibovis]